MACAGTINGTVCPNVCSSRDQWCDDAQASIPTRHGGSFWKKSQDVSASQLTAHDHLAGCINAVHLKDLLRDIQTDCRN
jgi:hypothetical protein